MDLKNGGDRAEPETLALAPGLLPPPGPGASPERLIELDALRGLAACAVVCGHFTGLYDPEKIAPWVYGILCYTPVFLLGSAHEAVFLFFILSGFVLSLPYIQGVRQPYGAYLTKRVFRIYVPYLAALALSVAGALHFHGLQGVSRWFSQTWSGPVDPRVVFQHLLFIGHYDIAALNTSFWSLPQEMRVSLIFPFLCAAVLRSPGAAVLAFAFLCPVLDPILHAHRLIPQTFFPFRYLGMFVFGIVLARHRRRLGGWLDALPRPRRLAFAAAALGLYFGAHFLTGRWQFLEGGVIEAGCGGLIVLCLGENRFSRWLRGLVPQFLGRISYSLYLLHGTVLFVLVYLFFGRCSLLWLFVPFLLLTLAGSVLFYRWVEKPALDAGRKLAKRF